MARWLKVFRTDLGFYDMIVAAPSQKAAAQAWQREDQVRDIESRKAALEAERRKMEHDFEIQILAVRRQIEKT